MAPTPKAQDFRIEFSAEDNYRNAQFNFRISHEKISRPSSHRAVHVLFRFAPKGPTVGNAVSYGNASDVDQVSLEFGSTDLQMMAENGLFAV